MRFSVGLAISFLFATAACGSSAGNGGFGSDASLGPDTSLSGETGSLGSTEAGRKDVSNTMSLGSSDSGSKDAACKSGQTCESLGVKCGSAPNGCGGTMQCGSCPAGETCGGGGKASECGSSCTPKTCKDQGFDCGPAGDGCGGMLQCGGCEAGTCGGGGKASVCGSEQMCTPTTCAALGFNCGPAGDGCGGMLACGSCTGNDICGGGGASVCGAGACQPTTCAAIGAATCGPQPDGCGNLLQCGTCDLPATCGGLTSGQCGIPASCTGLCLSQTSCSGTATTTISGVVFAPNGTDPLPNVLVYVPNAPVDAFTPGVACDKCSDGVSGSPLVTAVTDNFGAFHILNAPQGTNIPLVIQTGRWRRQVVIPTVTSCVDNVLPSCTSATATNGTCLTNLPQTKAQGDIPKMAFATGSIDALECVMRKIGVADSEFTDPTGTGRVNFYVGFESVQNDEAYALGGAAISANTPTEDALVGNAATLNKYDMVLFPCEEAEVASGQTVYNQQTGNKVGKWSTLGPEYQTNVINYANAGGRIFATHYSYIWLFNSTAAPFNATAKWDVNQCDTASPDDDCFPPDQTGYIQTNFPKGEELAEWLQNIGASTTQGQIPLNTLRWDIDASGIINPPGQLWMQIQDPDIGDVPMHYTFNTPTTAAAADQCGKVLFDDFHVENVTVTDAYGDQGLDDGFTFPNECTTSGMTPQEKLLEFMIFDLGSCVAATTPSCTPTTCGALGYDCGPAGDGCGNVIQCGTCPAGETCGGGGNPSVCGAPACTPTTCAAQGIKCGPAGDGCGNTLACGTCPGDETCGGGGTPGVCGAGSCAPVTCASQNLSCGPAGNGCGDSLDCGTCPSGETCGGGGKPGVCGSTCTPRTCAGLGYNCGAAGDGCGGELDCGTCAAPNTCGGGGQANICGGNIPK